eukprot:1138052-Pelagomonas_calceolata.AAC.6
MWYALGWGCGVSCWVRHPEHCGGAAAVRHLLVRCARLVALKCGRHGDVECPAGPGTLSTVAGRLLCDTYLLGVLAWLHWDVPVGILFVLGVYAARELVKEVDYTLRTLAQNLLGQAQMEMPPHQIPLCYESAEVGRKGAQMDCTKSHRATP